MALKRPGWGAGTVVVLEHDSKILRDNPLGDPHVRKLAVWLPPQYDGAGRRRFPVLYDLVGFTGSGLAHTNWKPFGDNVPERAARLAVAVLSGERPAVRGHEIRRLIDERAELRRRMRARRIEQVHRRFLAPVRLQTLCVRHEPPGLEGDALDRQPGHLRGTGYPGLFIANDYGVHPIVRSLSEEGLPVVFPLARSP